MVDQSAQPAIHVVDCRDVLTAEQFWSRYLEVVRPSRGDMFGRNLDAFWDAVERGGPGAPDAPVRFVNLAAVSKIRGGDFLAALHEIARDVTTGMVTFDDTEPTAP
ncbi:MAG TPA: barstar family protein [Caulobacteraceae bacterium]|nr:barstar family protein [Caulobacteraceae bacterium]